MREPMARAIILTVDDDAAVLQAITRDLRGRYGDRYSFARATSGAEALDVLATLVGRDDRVALVVSDHRMPGLTGIELLAAAKPVVPDAKLILLTAYASADGVKQPPIRRNAIEAPVRLPFVVRLMIPVRGIFLADRLAARHPAFDQVET